MHPRSKGSSPSRFQQHRETLTKIQCPPPITSHLISSHHRPALSKHARASLPHSPESPHFTAPKPDTGSQRQVQASSRPCFACPQTSQATIYNPQPSHPPTNHPAPCSAVRSASTRFSRLRVLSVGNLDQTCGGACLALRTEASLK